MVKVIKVGLALVEVDVAALESHRCSELDVPLCILSIEGCVGVGICCHNVGCVDGCNGMGN